MKFPEICYPEVQDLIAQLYNDIDFRDITSKQLKDRAGWILAEPTPLARMILVSDNSANLGNPTLVALRCGSILANLGNPAFLLGAFFQFVAKGVGSPRILPNICYLPICPLGK